MTEPTPTGQNEHKNKPRRKTSIPAILLRLLLSVIVGTIIGAVIYYSAVGWIPYFEQRVISPIENNLATQQALETQLIDLRADIQLNQNALATLEMGLIRAAEIGDAFRATQDMNSQLIISQTLAFATLDSRLSSLNRNLSALATAQMRNSDLSLNFSLLKTADLLVLANQYLLHANYGQAEIELDHARSELEDLRDKSPALLHPYLQEILDLTLEAIDDLPADYLLASGKIELARQLVWQGFPTPVGSITPTPFTTSTPTPDS